MAIVIWFRVLGNNQQILIIGLTFHSSGHTTHNKYWSTTERWHFLREVKQICVCALNCKLNFCIIKTKHHVTVRTEYTTHRARINFYLACCTVEFERKNDTTLVFLLSNCPQVLKIFYDLPVKYYFWCLWCMITRLYDRVQLSIYSTRALFL